MTGVEIAAGAAVVGAGMSVYGAISGAQSKAKAEQADAYFKNAQANELEQRELINEQIIQHQSDLAQRSFGAEFASTGREGAGIGGIMEIRKNTAMTIANDRRDAEFKAKMLRAGANVATQLASDEAASGYITGAGTLISGGLKAYDYMRGPSNTTNSLPMLSTVGGAGSTDLPVTTGGVV